MSGFGYIYPVMFDQSFCDHLEYVISGVLGKSANEDWRRCWCDGVLLPTLKSDYAKEKILAEREVMTRAWIDEGRIGSEERGQFLYDMILLFGDTTIDKLQKNERLESCIPMSDPDSWIFLDRENRIIKVQLP